MRIVLDGMGGDNAPEEIVKGAVAAAEAISDEICIVGDPDAERVLAFDHYVHDIEGIQPELVFKVRALSDGCILIRQILLHDLDDCSDHLSPPASAHVTGACPRSRGHIMSATPSAPVR